MAGTKKRILVIEDDDSVRSLLYRALSVAYEVETIADGSDAVVRVQKNPVADLMICDIMLPGADGLTIARRAKASMWASVPIIFLTARTTPRDVIQGIQAGARHYVTKPFKLKDLLDKVKKIVGA
jgi:DNA-binding response OmpR family regulator